MPQTMRHLNCNDHERKSPLALSAQFWIVSTTLTTLCFHQATSTECKYAALVSSSGEAEMEAPLPWD